MSDWTAGYVADIAYTFGYYADLNPIKVQLAFLNAGLALPENGTACELGFGQGLSVNMHAAASVTSWHGTDFNPSQTAFAQALTRASGSSANLLDEGFSDYCRRSDLPDFDYIGVHGIWSWISDENRKVIVEFIGRKLKPGGVLYISYNTQPGWATMLPMRHLLTQHSEVMAAKGQGIASRIDAAIDFSETMLATNPAYGIANPAVAERIKKIKELPRNYLAHEYFNRDWQPMHFAEMAAWLGAAKLNYACSAHYLDYVDALNLTPDQRAMLRDIPEPMFRETVRDFMVNQQFRRDYWVKGARRISVLEQAEGLRNLRVVLLTPRDEVSLKANGSLGEASLNESAYGPILDAMADHQPKRLDQLEQLLKDKSVTFGQILQCVMVLIGKNNIALVQDETVANKAQEQSNKLNACILDKARGNNDIAYLASPVTGGGVMANRFQQIFLFALAAGCETPEAWAQYAERILASQGQSLFKQGKALESEAERIAELAIQAREFALKHLPIFKALRVVA